MKLNDIQQFHVDNNFFLKVKRLANNKCECYIPQTFSSKANKRSYEYTNGFLNVYDEYYNKNYTFEIPAHVFRPAVLLDILILICKCNISQSITLLFGSEDELLSTQNIFALLPIELKGDDISNELTLIQDLNSILSGITNTDNNIVGYEFLQKCFINGGLVV